MILELILTGIVVNQAIDSANKKIIGRIECCQNRLAILQERVNRDLLMVENQTLKEELKQLKNSKET